MTTSLKIDTETMSKEYYMADETKKNDEAPQKPAAAAPSHKAEASKDHVAGAPAKVVKGVRKEEDKSPLDKSDSIDRSDTELDNEVAELGNPTLLQWYNAHKANGLSAKDAFKEALKGLSIKR